MPSRYVGHIYACRPISPPPYIFQYTCNYCKRQLTGGWEFLLTGDIYLWWRHSPVQRSVTLVGTSLWAFQKSKHFTWHIHIIEAYKGFGSLIPVPSIRQPGNKMNFPTHLELDYAGSLKPPQHNYADSADRKKKQQAPRAFKRRELIKCRLHFIRVKRSQNFR